MKLQIWTLINYLMKINDKPDLPKPVDIRNCSTIPPAVTILPKSPEGIYSYAGHHFGPASQVLPLAVQFFGPSVVHPKAFRSFFFWTLKVEVVIFIHVVVRLSEMHTRNIVNGMPILLKNQWFLTFFTAANPLNAIDVVWDPQVKIERAYAPE